ncbi:MAG: hypothetical protein AAFP70_05285 [Calditrichota bacterium]
MPKWVYLALCLSISIHLFASDEELNQVVFKKEWNETAREMILGEVAEDVYDALLLNDDQQDIFRADLQRSSFFVVPASGGDKQFSVVKADADDWKKLPFNISEIKGEIKGTIRPERSTMFMLNEKPILVLNSYQSIHYFVRERVSYFSLADDTLSFLGSMDIRKTENDEFMGLYDGDGITRRLRSETDSLGNVIIIADLTERSFSSFNLVNARYQEKYLLTHKGLALVSQASEKSNFASEPQAQAIMQTIAELYNTDKWLDDGSRRAKERQRAQYFLQSYQTLSRLIPTFAPPQYKLAKMHAILGNKKRASAALTEAVQLDEGLKFRAEKDADLRNIEIQTPQPVVIQKPEQSDTPASANREGA